MTGSYFLLTVFSWKKFEKFSIQFSELPSTIRSMKLSDYYELYTLLFQQYFLQ